MTQHMDERSPGPVEDQAGGDLPLIELETLLNRPPSQRKRLARGSLALLAALLALILFWSSLSSGKPAPTGIVPTPTPTPPTLLIASSVNYGTLTLNGKRLPGPLPTLVYVPGKSYDLTLDAPPFSPITCHLRLSDVKSRGFSSADGRCLAFSAHYDEPIALHGIVARPTFQVSIFLGMHDLPRDQQSQITALLTQTLTTQQAISVPAGDYFVTSFSPPTTIASQQASAPMHATASVALVPPQDQAAVPGCVGFICPWLIDQADYLPIDSQQWSIGVALATRWRFSTPSGSVVSDVLFQNDASGSIVPTAKLFLSYDAASGWSIAQDAAAPTAAGLLQGAFCTPGKNILQQVAGNESSIRMLNTQGAQGCELQLFVNDSFQGTFLWRFGVLLTADPIARQVYPQFPAAPAADVAAIGV
jgi:hypothetical protein